jgi:hypothetical protein
MGKMLFFGFLASLGAFMPVDRPYVNPSEIVYTTPSPGIRLDVSGYDYYPPPE